MRTAQHRNRHRNCDRAPYLPAPLAPVGAHGARPVVYLSERILEVYPSERILEVYPSERVLEVYPSERIP